MIQREILKAECVFRQVVLPNGQGEYTALFIIETKEFHFNLEATKKLLASNEYC